MVFPYHLYSEIRTIGAISVWKVPDLLAEGKEVSDMNHMLVWKFLLESETPYFSSNFIDQFKWRPSLTAGGWEIKILPYSIPFLIFFYVLSEFNIYL